MKNTALLYLNDEILAQVKVYSKKELCVLYNISKKTLATWIARSGSQFEATGYVKHQKLFTKAQIRLCFELWGEP
jgi:hypothetical protein